MAFAVVDTMPKNKSLFKTLRFETKAYLEFSPEIRSKIRSASLRGEGLFCESMRLYGSSATITVAFKREAVIGWAVHFTNKRDEDSIYCYVKRAYRRQGIGAALVNQMTSQFPNAYVYPHDSVSKLFYEDRRVNAPNIEWSACDEYFDDGYDEDWDEE